MVFAVVGLLALAGYFLATNRQVRLARRAWPATAAAAHGHGGEAAHGGHAHGGDEPTVKTTLWANKIDIFLERPYAVAGKAIEPLFHVTVMKNGSPVTEGSLIFKATGPDRAGRSPYRRSRPGRAFSFLR